MDRRNFLTGLFAVTSTATALSISGGRAEAASFVENVMVRESCPDIAASTETTADGFSDIPAAQAKEAQFYYRRPRRRVVYRRVVRRPIVRRRVLRQRCWYVRDRFGRVVRRCGFV